jgi:hypothetical protein
VKFVGSRELNHGDLKKVDSREIKAPQKPQ